jgi:hypothetical protein
LLFIGVEKVLYSELLRGLFVRVSNLALWVSDSYGAAAIL